MQIVRLEEQRCTKCCRCRNLALWSVDNTFSSGMNDGAVLCSFGGPDRVDDARATRRRESTEEDIVKKFEVDVNHCQSILALCHPSLRS